MSEIIALIKDSLKNIYDTKNAFELIKNIMDEFTVNTKNYLITLINIKLLDKQYSNMLNE